MTDHEVQELAALSSDLKLVRRIVNAVPAMLAYWDTEQRCVFANRAYERWFAVSPDWLVGRTMSELLGPIYALNLPHIEGALRGERQSFEREIPDPNGGPPRHAQADYLPDVEGGAVRGFFVLVSDITARKAVERALQREQRIAQEALARVKTLEGLLPICAWCHKIRDDQGQWNTIASYVTSHTDATVSHGMCDDCLARHFPPGEGGSAG